MWTYNNVKITVVELKEQAEQIIAKLQPLDAGTVYQSFGYVNDTYPLQCFIVGSGDVGYLKTLARDGTAYSLSFNGNSLGNFYLEKFTAQWLTSYRQTFREDKSATDLVYKAVLELSRA